MGSIVPIRNELRTGVIVGAEVDWPGIVRTCAEIWPELEWSVATYSDGAHGERGKARIATVEPSSYPAGIRLEVQPQSLPMLFGATWVMTAKIVISYETAHVRLLPALREARAWHHGLKK